MAYDDSHDSMSVSAGRDDNSNGRGTGPEGNGDGGNSSNGHRSSVDFSKTPEKQAIVNPWLLGLPANLAIIEGTWGVTINTTTLTSPLGRLAGLLESSLPMAGRLSAIGALFYSKEIGLDTIDPNFREHQQQLAKLVSENKQLQEQTYSFTTFPVGIVTDIPVEDISRQKTVPAKVVVEQIVSPEKNKVAPAMTKNPQQVNVVQAKKTGRPGIYSVDIVPGKPALQIGLSDKKPSPSFKTPSYGSVKPESLLGSPSPDTHDAIVDFGGDHAPIYISVSKKLTPAQEKQLIEEAKRREQEYLARHPIAAAERALGDAKKELDDANNAVKNEQLSLDKLRNSAEGLALKNPVAHPITLSSRHSISVPGYSGGGVSFDIKETINSLNNLNLLLRDGANSYVTNVLKFGEVTAPTPEGLKVGNGIKNAYISEYDKLRQRLFNTQNGIKEAEKRIAIALANKKKKEEKVKGAEEKVKEEKDKNKGKTPEIKIDGKIKGQIDKRGWTEQEIKDAVSKGPKGSSIDKRGPKKTPPDHLGRNDPATVYGKPGEYVVINDRTGEVAQVSDKTDKGWIDDSRIQWENK